MKQKSARFRQPTTEEQQVLIHLNVRRVLPGETARFNQIITDNHYLKSASVVGEHLRYPPAASRLLEKLRQVAALQGHSPGEEPENPTVTQLCDATASVCVLNVVFPRT